MATVECLLEIGRLVAQEHREWAAKEQIEHEENQRWQELRGEYHAARREGRRMKTDWSWERELPTSEEPTP